MKNTLFVVVAFVALFAVHCVAADEEAAEGASDVLVLTTENFHSTIAASPSILVEFYAPWCGHCKALAPEYEKAATALKGRYPIAKVDCTANTDVCTEFGVQGYPTIKIFRDGVPEDAEVARKADPIIQFCEGELRPAVTFLETAEALKEFTEKSDVTVVAFLDNNHDDRYKAFEGVAKGLKSQLSFAAVAGKDFSKEYTNNAEVPTVVLFRKGDTNAYFSGDFSNDLRSFIQVQRVPLLAEIGPDNYKMYVDVNFPIGFVFLDLTKDNTETKATFLKLASEFRGKLFFTIVDNTRFNGQATRMGLSGKVVPSLAIDNPASGFHYAFPEDKALTEADVTQYVQSFLDNKLEPTIKSEPIPESNDGPVKVLVALNFDSIVMDTTKDVLVEFYAPWCGHCKKLAPIFDELGQYFQSNPSVVIAKIDATANDVSPAFGIRGFPTLLFFPANNKTPVDYQGSRDLEDLKNFVQKHASIPLDGAKEQPAKETKDEL